jgi:hypothetical protein
LFAAFWEVSKLLVMEEELFACGKNKFIPTVHTLKNSVREVHLGGTSARSPESAGICFTTKTA